MNTLTRILIGTTFILASSIAIADDYKGFKGEVPLSPVTVPVLKGGFEFTLAALYLQPSSNNLTYVSAQQLNNSGILISEDTESIEPDYGWGFLLGLGYIIPNSANDIQLNWMHFNDNDEDSENYVTPVSGSTNIIRIPGNQILRLRGVGDFANVSANAKYKFDAVDLDFGRYINITNRLQTRLFAGLRYARIDNDLSVSYDGAATVIDLAPNQFLSLSLDSDSTFNGIGPLFGISGNYNVGYGFGIAGAFDIALLVGEIDFDQDLSSLSGTPNVPTSNSYFNESFDYDDTHIISPAFDAKLGLNYSYIMNSGMQLKLELGYLATKYIDVIETGEFDTSDPIETINFSLMGPYLSLDVKV